MALNTYEGSREAEVQADPLDNATSFKAMSSDSPVMHKLIPKGSFINSVPQNFTFLVPLTPTPPPPHPSYYVFFSTHNINIKSQYLHYMIYGN